MRRSFAHLTSQIIFDGEEHPSWSLWSEGLVQHCCSERVSLLHDRALLQLVGSLQSQVVGKEKLIIFDRATTHASTNFHEKVKEVYPRCGLCYIEPRKNTYTEPLNLVVLRLWKAQGLVQTSAGRQWAESVLARADPHGFGDRMNLHDLVGSRSKVFGARRRSMTRHGNISHYQTLWKSGNKLQAVDEQQVLNEASYLFAYFHLNEHEEEGQCETLGSKIDIDSVRTNQKYLKISKQ
eukprot:2649213-Amphidinium_carterae.2